MLLLIWLVLCLVVVSFLLLLPTAWYRSIYNRSLLSGYKLNRFSWLSGQGKSSWESTL
jgi:uncharacterized membrane protein YkgB